MNFNKKILTSCFAASLLCFATSPIQAMHDLAEEVVRHKPRIQVNVVERG